MNLNIHMKWQKINTEKIKFANDMLQVNLPGTNDII